MNIVIITDGNSQQGLGHVYQSKTLAKYLLMQKKYSPQIIFLTKSDECVVQLIQQDGFDVLRFKSDDEIFNYLEDQKPYVVIFDKVDVSPLLAQKLKLEIGLKLVIFTNLTEANSFADISVMGTMGSGFKNHVKYVSGKHEFWGPKYLILRPEFFIKKENCNFKVDKILLLLGGADPANLTCSILKMLLVQAKNYDIKIILGTANDKEIQIKQILKDYQAVNKVEILNNVSRVSEVMLSVDLAIVSPGISFFEALITGIPVICFYQNDFQYNAWKDDVRIYGQSEVAMIKEILDAKEFIFPDSLFVKSMEIGRGIDELVTKILE